MTIKLLDVFIIASCRYAIVQKNKEAASYQLTASIRFAHFVGPNARICVCCWWRRSTTNLTHNILRSEYKNRTDSKEALELYLINYIAFPCLLQ